MLINQLFSSAVNPMLTPQQCDEKTPRCSHCTRRQEQCQWSTDKQGDGLDTYVTIDTRISPESSPSVLAPSSPPALDVSVVNLLHMKLFRHFETHTRHTLAFNSLWDEAIRLSLDCESLMHAILCLAAEHLAFLLPEEPQYEMAAATHLSQTLRLFQQDLAETVTALNADCHLTTATLLSYIVWNEIDTLPTGADSLLTVNALEDRVFSIGRGTLQMFMSASFWISRQQSIFMPHVVYSPRVTLCHFISLSDTIIDLYQSFFDYDRPLTADRLSIPNYFSSLGAETVNEKDLASHFDLPNEAPEAVEAYTLVIRRLCIILSFLPEMRSLRTEKAYEDVLPDLARYIFTFPIVCFRECEALARRQDPKWWLVLYHFYRAARIVLPDHFWWAQRRSRLMESLLKELLLGECARTNSDHL